MKTTIYTQLVSCKSNATVNTLTAVTKSAASKAIQARHALWVSDNKNTRKDMERVYRDWYQVYRMQKPAQRMVKQAEVDTFDKMQIYLAPIFVSDSYCCITTADRSADAVRSKVTKSGKTTYLAPIRWTVSALETAVKYCAKYYAGIEQDIESKFNELQ